MTPFTNLFRLGIHSGCLQLAIHNADGFVAYVRSQIRPKHRLMGVGTALGGVRGGHVVSSQTTADHGVVVVFNTTTAQVHVVEAGGVTSLSIKRGGRSYTGWDV